MRALYKCLYFVVSSEFSKALHTAFAPDWESNMLAIYIQKTEMLLIQYTAAFYTLRECFKNTCPLTQNVFKYPCWSLFMKYFTHQFIIQCIKHIH